MATFRILETAPDDFLAEIIRQVADLFASAPRSELPNHEGWWSRLFQVSVAFGKEPEDTDQDFYGAAINSPGGRLTESALIDIENVRKSGADVMPWLVGSISIAAKAAGWQGTMARAVLIRHLSFVISIEGHQASQTLNTALSGQTPEAERGITIGRYNARGVTWQVEGGTQERELADQYEDWAKACEFEHPRMARILREMVRKYIAEAEWQDNEAMIRRRMRY